MTRTFPEWLAYIERQHPKSIDMGLQRVRVVATRMRLERPARRVITVAGTNGKGSTVAFIDSIARAAGWKVGAYMSPHLLAYNERVRIEGREASDEELVAAFEAIEAARLSPASRGQDISLTYFEYGTLAALWLFAQNDLDLAILEVGLGGRLDATNIVDPDVAVITTVDLDHQDYLGNDREAIGFEKAGIARAWKPLVLGDDDPPASVLRHAYAIGASAVRAGCDYFFEPIDADTWRWRDVGFELELPMPRLAAPAQLRNAATAVAALRALDAPVTDAAWREGIATAHLPARLQRFVRDGVEIVVDVAHNPQAARELSRWLRDTPIAGRSIAVFGALGDKDLEGVVAAVAGQIDAWYLAGLVEAGPRGLTAEALATRLHATDARDGEAFNTVAQAMTAARLKTKPGDRILVFGSFRTAAAALQALNDT
ncbi:MAG: bifunctional tetrahydrofolate synthase/dihydrofolate synthase [Lysobacter sp.]|nr:bifunctional tetrahydrofolate synthase/dihydrofolate synthase [Lysobacter sp.]